MSSRSRSAFSITVIAVVGVLFSCADRTNDEDAPATSRSAGSSADSSSPSPVADAAPEPRRPSDGGGAYPYCEALNPDGWVTFCDPSRNGHGYSLWHTESSSARYCGSDGTITDCNTCLCYVGCAEESPCPQPPSGTAVAQCLGPPNTMKSCVLPCDAGEQCPDGMTCVDEPDLHRKICAWLRAD
jgi:hypothetical protein